MKAPTRVSAERRPEQSPVRRRAERATPAPARDEGVAGVLGALQRTAGNQAVNQLLRRYTTQRVAQPPGPGTGTRRRLHGRAVPRRAAPLRRRGKALASHPITRRPSEEALDAALLSLQRRLGPLALVQRQDHGGTAVVDAGGPTAGVAPATDALPADLVAFRAHGPYPDAAGQTVAPSTGMGGFNASYDPAGMVLTVTVNVAMTFVDGMTIAGDHVEAADPSLAGAATGINTALSRLHGARLNAALDRVKQDWQWTGGASDPRITTWMDDYRSQVMGAWSTAGTGLSFESSKPGWESQRSDVAVVVNTSNAAAAAPGGAPPGPTPIHCQATIYKTADDNTDFGSNVGPGSAASGTDQTLELGSGQLHTPTRLLNQSVTFANNSATLNNAARDTLRRFIVSFQAPAGGSGTTIDITGRANTVGSGTPAGDEHNRLLSQRRADAVAEFLRTEEVEGKTLANATTRIQGATGAGSDGATEEAEWRRVDIAVAGSQGQNVILHEFGHMIGLDDEYASTPQRDAAGNVEKDDDGNAKTRGLISGTGGDVGDATATDALSQSEGLGHSVAENNDNVMSLGSTIRPPHYATFMEALRLVTGAAEWRLHS